MAQPEVPPRVESPGARLYDVRLACGDGRRDPMPLAKFAEHIRATTGVYYDPATLSLLERMKQGWKWQDIDLLARVDPMQRGRVWLSALAERDAVPDLPLPWEVVESRPAKVAEPTPSRRGPAAKKGRAREA